MFATCHTAGCAAGGIAVDLGEPEEDPNLEPGTVVGVICGVCGQPITDVTDAPGAGEPTTERTAP